MNTQTKKIGILITISCLFLVIAIFDKESNLIYLGIAFFLNLLMVLSRKFYETIGFISFIGLVLSLILAVFSLAPVAKLTSEISFIGILSFLIISIFSREL